MIKSFYHWKNTEDRKAFVQRFFASEDHHSLELGFGNGDYLTRSAKKEPSKLFIGIESSWSCCKKARKRIASLGLKNCCILWGDIPEIFSVCFPLESIANILSLFPCPWPKKRHRSHRLFLDTSLALLASRMKKGSLLTIATDALDYAEEIMQASNLDGAGLEGRLEMTGAKWGTKYEQKWVGQGQTRFAEISLTKQKSIASCIIEEQSAMRKPKLHSRPKDADFFQDCSEPYVLELKDYLNDNKQDISMFHFFTCEETLTQHFWMRCRKAKDCYFLEIAPGCSCIPSPALQFALDEFARQFTASLEDAKE